MIWLVLELLVILVLALFYFALLASLRAEAPYVPTSGRESARIFEALGLKPGQVFYDLGSGDGRVVWAAARRGAKAIGFEQSRLLVGWSRVWGGSASFIRGDYLKEDLGQADVIFCYLMPKAMEHLKPKFEQELKPGTRVVSRAFKIPGWTPVERLKFTKRSPPVYVYLIK